MTHWDCNKADHGDSAWQMHVSNTVVFGQHAIPNTHGWCFCCIDGNPNNYPPKLKPACHYFGCCISFLVVMPCFLAKCLPELFKFFDPDRPVDIDEDDPVEKCCTACCCCCRRPKGDETENATSAPTSTCSTCGGLDGWSCYVLCDGCNDCRV